MANGNDSGDDKEHPATPRRLEKAREAGNVPLSREATSFIVLLAVTLLLLFQEPSAIRSAARGLSRFIGNSYDPRVLSSASAWTVLHAIAWLIGPVLGAAAAAGCLAVLAQTRLLVRMAAASPDLSRISPLAGLKRLFGLRSLLEVVKSIARLGITGGVIVFAVQSRITDLELSSRYEVRQLPALLGTFLFRILLAGIAAQAIIGLADFAWTNFKYIRDLRMSKQDIRDEYKETEGNPFIKGHLKALGRAMVRNNIRKAVPKAAVVVTNPTHYAVALAYDRETHPAPRIVAKGSDLLAAEIRKIAQQSNVPLVSNAPLARALFRLQVDSEIPAEHYKAVAEIIAFVWRLRTQHQPGG